VEWEKVACWSTKAAISPKRVKIEEKLVWRAYRKSQTLFPTVTIPNSFGLPFPKIGGSQPHPKTAIAIGTAKVRADTFTGSIRTQAHEKLWRKGSVGVCRDGPNFLSTPIISGTGEATNFKFGSYIHRVHLNKSSLKNWEKRERGHIQGLPNEYPILSQVRVKPRFSNLAATFTGSILTNAH